MTETRKTRKILKKSAKSSKIHSAEDLICIPRPLYEQMIALLKGQTNNGGRAKNLLDALPEVEKI